MDWTARTPLHADGLLRAIFILVTILSHENTGDVPVVGSRGDCYAGGCGAGGHPSATMPDRLLLELPRTCQHAAAAGKEFAEGKRVDAGRETEETEFMLATVPPTSEQRRLALVIVTALFAVFATTVAIGLTSPLALIPVRIDAFVPVLAALLFVNDFITAALLFGQFSIIRSRALLVIANGYLFTGLMAVVFALTFPGQFSATGLLGAGLQTSAWI